MKDGAWRTTRSAYGCRACLSPRRARSVPRRQSNAPLATLYVTLGIPAVNLYHRLDFIEADPTYIEAERMITK